MNKDRKFKVIQKNLTDTRDFKRGQGIYYRCKLCGSLVNSIAKDNIGCDCGNIFIDFDYFRLSIEDYKSVEVVQEVSSS